MRVFIALDDKSIVKAENGVFLTHIFSTITLYLFGGKLEFLKFWTIKVS